MATITYNNRSVGNATSMITFTDIPNILKVSDSNAGSTTSVLFQLNGNLASVSHTEPWYITVMGETISSVDSFKDAYNKNFFVSQSNVTTAASITKAFRNCPALAANFKIVHDGNKIRFTARAIGKFDVPISSNISTTYLTRSVTQGSATSPLNGSKIDVDVYVGYGGMMTNYVTSLEKNFYNGEAAFDMSPVLTTFSKNGVVTPYWFSVSAINSSGEYVDVGNVSTNYITGGYMVNQGQKYLPLSTRIMIAQNYSRGTEKSVDNNTLLYVYGNSIPLSFYSSTTGDTAHFDINYLNSAYESIGGADFNYTRGSNPLNNAEIPLSSTLMKDSFYVDVEVESTGETIRYNIIKPIKATEYYQRILWRNSYGGVSFFDFTGQKTESRDLDVETYQKNIFDYYTDPRNELEKVYNNNVKYTVTLKSHLFENDGKYIFNDLLQSPEVWTERNGEQYAIIVDSINVDETDRNNIYEATLKFHYSQEPSLI